MHKNFSLLVKVSLILVYLVIIAGSVVRMTGSGMGCPDWPKCFGYYIPPTQASELEWQAGREYKKGQVIIRDRELRVAKEDFTTGTTYNPPQWEPYEKHDYAVFNPFHTWTEYINRLLGALAGMSTLVLALYSLRFRKSRPQRTFWSWVILFGMLFQGWLGATVVYSVLEPIKISIHMVMALLIVALLIYLLYLSREKPERPAISLQLAYTLLVIFIFTVVQVLLGIQVREFTDHQSEVLGEALRAQWLADPPMVFYIHRSFSVLLLLANIYAASLLMKSPLPAWGTYWILILLGLSLISGITMNYFGFPAAAQPLHLLLAALLFGIQFYLLLLVKYAFGNPKSL